MWCGISRIFILCSCSGCIQKHYRIVYLGRAFVPNGLMASFKVIGVDIPSNGFSCFLEISILREICFLILEAAEPAFNHDIICPSTFAIHALPDAVYLYKINVLLTCKLATLIRIQYLRFCYLKCLFLSINDHSGIKRIINFPADNTAAVPVDNSCQI